jgi:hypothetical protein
MNPLKVLGTVFKPAQEAHAKHTDKKMLDKRIDGKLAQAKQEHQTEIVFNEQEIDRLNVRQKGNGLMDEYATISVLSILNIIVIGGILAAFGITEVLSGINLAIQTLQSVGVRVGLLMETVIGAAVGFHLVKRFTS